MAAMRRAPTIIVFTREPTAGTTKTRLIPRLGATNAAALADAFTRDALARAAGLGAPLVIGASAAGGAARSRYFRALARHFGAHIMDQGVGHLGLRMARLLEPYLADGAILIGTDTPSLPLALLRRSVAMMRSSDVVLGPSLDGGYYLVGARGALPPIFRGIRWGSGRVLADTISRLERIGAGYALGPAWYDVDRFSDVALLSEHLRLMRRKHQTIPCPATAQVLARIGLLHPSKCALGLHQGGR
jgi:rSAM/selenodomain-associated transferase 1